jgi:hypothetical protein
MHKKLYAYVPSDRMKQVIAAFSVAVSVSCNSDHRHFVVSQLQARRNRQAPAMETIEGIAFEVVWKLCCLSYA